MLYLRNLVDIEQLLFVLREYYSLVAEEGERSETHCHVRPYLLLIMKAYLTKVRLCIYICIFGRVEDNVVRRFPHYMSV